MKVDDKVTIYAWGQSENTSESAKADQKNRKTIFAGDLNQEDTLADRIAEKKAKAQKQALKLVKDAFDGDREIDEDLESRREHVDDLREEKKVLQEEAAGVASRQKDLEDAYANGEVSDQEYMSQMADIKEESQVYADKLSDNENEVLTENSIVRGTKLERLKTNPMGEARNQADEIMEASSEEIIGMVMDDAKEKLDEEDEKREEQAEEIKEEREEQEELIEKRKEEKEEDEPVTDDMPIDEMTSLNRTQSEVQKEVQDIVDKMKLLAEDIKGAVVDEVR
jgi:hypothetical protein